MEKAAVPTAKALYQGGIRAVEITIDSGALRMIEEVKSACGDKMVIGAGTVLDAENATAAIRAGADYTFPDPFLKVIEQTATANWQFRCAYANGNSYGMGGGSPAGKVFPARVFGPEYIKDMGTY